MPTTTCRWMGPRSRSDGVSQYSLTHQGKNLTVFQSEQLGPGEQLTLQQAHNGQYTASYNIGHAVLAASWDPRAHEMRAAPTDFLYFTHFGRQLELCKIGVLDFRLGKQGSLGDSGNTVIWRRHMRCLFFCGLLSGFPIPMLTGDSDFLFLPRCFSWPLTACHDFANGSLYCFCSGSTGIWRLRGLCMGSAEVRQGWDKACLSAHCGLCLVLACSRVRVAEYWQMIEDEAGKAVIDSRVCPCQKAFSVTLYPLAPPTLSSLD